MLNSQNLRRQVPQIININELAYLTGSTPTAVRQAGAALFESLSGDDPDLSRALIAACNASGVEPRNMIAMMNVLALEFRRLPTDDAEEEIREDESKPPEQLPIIKRIAARASARRSKRKEKKHG